MYCVEQSAVSNGASGSCPRWREEDVVCGGVKVGSLLQCGLCEYFFSFGAMLVESVKALLGIFRLLSVLVLPFVFCG